jgi:serine/threonine-protein kinase
MPDTSPTLRDLFDACLDLPPAERAAFLLAQCPDVAVRGHIERLLQADARDDRLFAGGAQAAANVIGETESGARLPVGSRVGPFEIVRMLGEGGSATVFLAQRESDGVRQQVALKILSRGLYSVDAQRQFRRERTALTQLTHPGIARLIEGGVTDEGVAYIALEFVDGVSITAYARERKLNLRERLLLFVQACRAVEAAHRALIVHRDLKPSNVFVASDGNVKLLDFGIAKLLQSDDEERTRLPMLTPAYAAPEQHVGGAITTATDVYALGVLLGELVTGHRLSGADTGAPSSYVSDAAADGELPDTPTQTRRAVRGDLDNILRKSLDAEGERRYASAGAFADDIGLLLDGKPVAAHPPSRWYRTQKFVHRHRASVAFAAIFLIAILGALGIALWQTRVARLELRRADAFHDFMVEAFVQAEPGSPREGPPRITDVAEKAIAHARDDATMDDGVRAELLDSLGQMLRHQGRLPMARDTLQWNYDRARAAFGETAPATLRAGYQLTLTLESSGDFAAARALADRLLDSSHDQFELRRELLLVSSMLATKRRDTTRGLADANEAIALSREENDIAHVAEALSYLSNAQLSAGDVTGAIATGEEQLALRIRQYGPKHIYVSSAHATLSRAYRRAHDIDAAERHINAALDIDQAVLPEFDWRRSRHLNALMALRMEQRDYRAALDAATKGLAIDRVAYGDDNVETVNDLSSIGSLDLLLEDYAGALTTLDELIARTDGKPMTGRNDPSSPHFRHAVALANTGKYEAGISELRKALDDTPKRDAAQQVDGYLRLTELQVDHGDGAAALANLDTLDATVATAKDDEARQLAVVLRARVCLLLGRAADARAQLDREANEHPNGFSDPVAATEAPLRAATAVALKVSPRADADVGFSHLKSLRNPPSRLTRLAESLHRELGDTAMM